MYYVAELGWYKKKGKYKSECRVGLIAREKNTYSIHGMHYTKRNGKGWQLVPKTVWCHQNPEGFLVGELKKGRTVEIAHNSIDKLILADVLAVSEVEGPITFRRVL